MGEDGPILASVELLLFAVERITAFGEVPSFLFGAEDILLLNPSVVLVKIVRLGHFAVI